MTKRHNDMPSLGATSARSADPLQVLTRNAPGAFFLFNEHGLLLLAEGAAIPSLGMQPDALIGHPIERLFPALPLVTEAFSRAIAGEEPAHTVTYNGRTWLVRHSPFGKGESLSGVVAFWSELPAQSDRVHVDADERFRSFSEAAHEGLLLHDGELILDANNALATMFGHTRHGLTGKKVASLLHGKGAKTPPKVPTEESLETVGLRHDGTTFPIEIRARDIHYHGRTVISWSIWDITQRKRAEVALLETDARYKSLFHNSNDVIVTCDVEGNITSLNECGEKISGYSRVEALTMNASELIAPASLSLGRKALRRILAGQDVSVFQVDIITKAGNCITLEMSARALFQDMQPIGAQGVARDVTQRKRMEGELQFRLRFEQLVLGISTEFNNLAFDQIDDGIRRSLASIAEFCGADQSYVFRFHREESSLENTHQWPVEDATKAQATGTQTPPRILLTDVSWTMARLGGFEAVKVSHLDVLPAEAAPERALLAGRGIQAMLCVPMLHAGNLVGFLGLAAHKGPVDWSDDAVAMLRMVGEIFSNALERKRHEEALHFSEERFKLAALGANDGLWDWDLRSGRIHFSARWKALLGYAEDEISNSPEEWISRIHPDERAGFIVDLDEHTNRTASHFEFEHRMLHRDGKYRWMLSRGIGVRDEAGKVTRMAGSQTDITNRKEAESKLVHDAFHDSLTGLPNRVLFLDRLSRTLKRAQRRKNATFAVLFMDLDRFKVVNDGLGHGTGDKLLIEIAARLEKCVRPSDTIGRMGGDEFTVLLEDLDGDMDATRVAERIQDAIRQPFNLGGHDIFTSASIGIAYYDSVYMEPEEMLRDADTAMYRAKSLGKTRYAIFDVDMHERASQRLELENDLRRALEGREFLLHYQPIVSLRQMKITGFEALVRWQHPTRGLVSPADFIPVVEENGLIIPLGQTVLLEACRQASIWQAQPGTSPELSMSINLSTRQFAQPDLAGQIAQVLVETGVTPGSIRLEITESVLMEHAESVSRLLSELKAMRCKIQIDDFGTGYSSLSYLHSFRFDALKIDRSFVSRLDIEENSGEIVRSIIKLAHDLRMPVIAEGIETRKQLDFLKAMGCDYGQGYFFSKPLDCDGASQLLSAPPAW
jgi:diguanylate cyclase (GGDEF)-like protein/PAS domain S-box-containing protein